MPANEANATRAVSRGRGLGRGRGRGRGRGKGHGPLDRSSETSNTIHNDFRAQRQITKSHVANLSAAARQELVCRKRTAELQRVLLPDAPARKRRAQCASPDREVCEMLVQPSTSHGQIVDAAPFEMDLDCQQHILPTFNTEPEVILELEVQEGSTVLLPSTSMQLKEIGVTAPDLDSIVTEWLSLSDDEDMDDDEIEPGISLPVNNARTATCQAADVAAGLSLAEVEILQREDEASDLHVRGIVSSDDYFRFSWTKDRQTFTGTREIFSGTPGPTFPMTDNLRPTDIFYKMFDSDFIDLLVTETNRYAAQTVEKLRQLDTTAKYSRLLRWTPTDRDEMVGFLAVFILQGLYPKVKEEAYFSYDGFGTTPYFASIMSYNRYRLLKTFHHFIDNDTTTDMTKLNKIRPVIDYMNSKFASLYYPEQEVAIDESLLKWHGRLSFAQKINTKAAKVGIKTYELCESSSGYLWRFQVYTGKDGPNRTGQTDRQEEAVSSTLPEVESSQGVESGDRLLSEVRPSNATSKIVYDLIEPLLHRGHTLIMDNFYNSPLLARCLKRDGRTDVYGTLRLNREFVPDSIKSMTKTAMRQGEVVASYCSDLSVMLWRDANLVSMISTYHPLQVGTKDKFNKVVYKPAMVLDYNKSMGGVDRKDQYLASQPLERHRNKVWYKKLFRRLFNVAVFNSFVIFKSNPTNKLSHRQFRTVLAEDLILIHRKVDLKVEPRLIPNRSQTAAATPTLSLRRVTSKSYVEHNHFPMKNGKKFSRCSMCARKNVVSRTAFKCEACDVNLCIVGCFKEYHKLT